MSACSVDGCHKAARTRGWCHNHYEMWRRNGTAERQTPKAVAFLQEALRAQTDDCIDWPFSLSGSGYGQIWFGGTMRPAHRVALELACGEAPTQQHHAAHEPGVCHNKLCINPRHLRWATATENAADKLVDGTHNRGERCGTARLSKSDVLTIIGRLSKGHRQAAIAQDCGVSQGLISMINTRQRWAES